MDVHALENWPRYSNERFCNSPEPKLSLMDMGGRSDVN